MRYLDERPGVYACPDTGHLLLCGSDPVQTILDLGDRCRYLHLKDIRPEMVGKRTQRGEKFCELGRGALDLAGVLSALKKIRYAGWIMVERDNRVDDHVASASKMRNVLKSSRLLMGARLGQRPAWGRVQVRPAQDRGELAPLVGDIEGEVAHVFIGLLKCLGSIGHDHDRLFMGCGLAAFSPPARSVLTARIRNPSGGPSQGQMANPAYRRRPGGCRC